MTSLCALRVKASRSLGVSTPARVSCLLLCGIVHTHPEPQPLPPPPPPCSSSRPPLLSSWAAMCRHQSTRASKGAQGTQAIMCWAHLLAPPLPPPLPPPPLLPLPQ
jgi:hypothetical protein